MPKVSTIHFKQYMGGYIIFKHVQYEKWHNEVLFISKMQRHIFKHLRIIMTDQIQKDASKCPLPATVQQKRLQCGQIGGACTGTGSTLII